MEPRLQALTTEHSFKLVALKLVTPGKEHLEKHCRFPTTPLLISSFDTDPGTDADLSSKPFFAGLVECTSFSLPIWVSY